MLEIRNQHLVWIIETKDLWRQETCSCTMQCSQIWNLKYNARTYVYKFEPGKQKYTKLKKWSEILEIRFTC